MRTEGPIRVVALMEALTVTGPAKNLIEFARRAGPRAEVSLLTFHRGPLTAPTPFMAAAAAAGLKLDVIREKHVFDPGVLPQLRQAIAACRPDIVQTHNTKSHFLFRLAGLPRHYRWIAFLHGYTTPNLKMRLYNQLDRLSLPRADRVVTVCEAFARQVERYGVPRQRIRIQHNTVSPFEAAPAEEIIGLRDGLAIPASAAVILCPGRMSREKGQADLIAALARLGRPADAVRLVLAGDGPERRRLEQLCGRLPLAETVIFAGHVPDLRAWYSIADIVALPSHSEGSPNVLLEALAAGVPVVATAVGGVPEIVGHEDSALLVARRDIDGMARALGRLLDDRDLAARLAARGKEIVTGYRPEVYCRRLLELYEETVGRKEPVRQP